MHFALYGRSPSTGAAVRDLRGDFVTHGRTFAIFAQATIVRSLEGVNDIGDSGGNPLVSHSVEHVFWRRVFFPIMSQRKILSLKKLLCFRRL